MDKIKVYLAGKITANWWRDNLIGNLRGFISSRTDYFCEEIDYKDFVYVGPYSIGCDHKCYHHEGFHAAGSYTNDCNGLELTENDVMNACTNQIRKSNLVFAYIDSNNALGTFAEIGFAYALNIPVFILFESESLKNELWFISEMAKKCFVETNLFGRDRSIVEAFNQALAFAKLMII